jgi:hypothetical protein
MADALKHIDKFFWLLILIVTLSMLSLSSCFDNSDCANSYSDTLNISFFRINTTTPQPLTLVQVRALEARQIVFDSLNARATARMEFPVNPFSDTTTYIFEQPEHIDTVVAIFNRRPILINPECGMTQIIDIDTVFATFDSVRVVNPGLRYSRGPTIVNLEIYH